MKYCMVILAALLIAIPVSAEQEPVAKQRPMAQPATVVINGNILPRPGWIINGRTHVPVRDVFTRLGARVWYDDTNGAIEIEFRDTQIHMKTGDVVMTVTHYGGMVKIVHMDTPPIVAYGAAYIPVRFVTYEMGLLLEWAPETSTVLITKWKERYEPFW